MHGGCTNAIHDGIHQLLELLDPALSKILMLIMRFTLPIIDAVSMQDFLDLVVYLYLGAVADKLGWGSPCPDSVFQSIDELPIGFDGINISDKGFDTNKNLSDGSTRVNSWGVRIYGICCNWLISPVDIKSGKR